MKHMKIAIASLQANGQIERYNRMLAPALGKLYDGKDWYKTLIEFAMNNTMSRVKLLADCCLAYRCGGRCLMD